MGYSVEKTAEGCYPGTTCLINKPDIKDETQLLLVESQVSFAKASQLEQNPIKGNFDFSHYKAIHEYLFEDIYDWAGKIRTVNISKKGTLFVDYKDIDDIADKVFRRLISNDLYVKCNYDEFVDNIIDFYCSTNILHPFREGNGRTQRAFIAQLIRNAGYNINFARIDIDELMIATIQSANGVTDNLIKIFRDNIVKRLNQ